MSGHVDDTDNMFDPLVEFEVITYRVCRAQNAEEAAALGQVYLVDSDTDRDDPLLASGDTLEIAEEELDYLAYYMERTPTHLRVL